MAETSGGSREAAPSTPFRLLGFCLPAFHTAFLVSLLVFGLYASGAAGDFLAGLQTWIGVAVYLYLWGITWWTNRRWLDSIDGGLLSGRSETAPILRSALLWGGVTGLVFFAAPLVVAAAFFVAGGGLGAIPFLLIAAIAGSAVSFLVGGLVGGLFAGLDLLLLRASESVLPARPDDASIRD